MGAAIKKQLTFGFAGLGLIGGSIAKALRAAMPECTIIVYDVNQQGLEPARDSGVANVIAPHLDQAFAGCDYLFLCAPVAYNEENLIRVLPFLSAECLITDVGSVKTPIHRAVSRLGAEHRFIGGHPMTGSERTGFANARAGLLENAYYILTPAPGVSGERREEYQELVKLMGALPLVMGWEEHDYVTAAVSHLPHIIAAALVRLVRDSDSPEGVMKMIAAGGFKDITRIASSPARMWQQICQNNHVHIRLLLEEFIRVLNTAATDIGTQETAGLFDFFEEARLYRDSFIEASRGPLKKVHALYVDIPDKAGTLAAIVTLFAGHDINIKNIGISHNREQEDGVLLIEFYDGPSVNRSGLLLSDAGYSFHIKV